MTWRESAFHGTALEPGKEYVNLDEKASGQHDGQEQKHRKHEYPVHFREQGDDAHDAADADEEHDQHRGQHQRHAFVHVGVKGVDFLKASQQRACVVEGVGKQKPYDGIAEKFDARFSGHDASSG